MKYLINKLTRNIIHTLLSEANFRKYGKPSSSDSNGKRKGRLTINYAKSEQKRSAVTGQMKECICVGLGHVFKDGVSELINAINTHVPQNILNAAIGDNISRVVLRINIQKINEINSIIDKLEDAIKSVGDYTDDSIESVCSSLYDNIDSVATSQDIENAHNASIKTWQDMLERLNDPEVRKRLLRYQMTNDYARAYGHVLSSRNIHQVLDQFPNASFVAKPSTWTKIFKRTVNPNAQRIVVTLPLKNYAGSNALDDAARKCGYNSYKDARKLTGDAPQVLHKIRIEAQKNSAAYFHQVVMYDVSQTTPIDPSHDVWSETIGLTNNIDGELNIPAQELDMRLSNDQDATLLANKKAISDAQHNKWENRRRVLERACKKANINIDSLSNLSTQQFICHAMFEYAKVMTKKYGIIRDEDVNVLSAMCVHAMCDSCDCPIDRVYIKYLDSPKRKLTQQEALAAFTIVRGLLPDLRTAASADFIRSVNETYGDDIISYEEFRQMCQQEFGGYDDITNESLDKLISKIIRESLKKY